MGRVKGKGGRGREKGKREGKRERGKGKGKEGREKGQDGREMGEERRERDDKNLHKKPNLTKNSIINAFKKILGGILKLTFTVHQSAPLYTTKIQ